MSNYKPKLVLGYAQDTGTPLDGQKLVFAQWAYDKHSCWHLYGWDDAADNAVMRTFHDADELYSDMPIDEFEQLWKSKEYEPGGSYCIDLDKVRVSDILSEEVVDSILTAGAGRPQRL